MTANLLNDFLLSIYLDNFICSLNRRIKINGSILEVIYTEILCFIFDTLKVFLSFDDFDTLMDFSLRYVQLFFIHSMTNTFIFEDQEIKSRIAIVKNAFNKKKSSSFKKNEQRFEEGIKDYRLECRVVWIVNLDIKKVWCYTLH